MSYVVYLKMGQIKFDLDNDPQSIAQKSVQCIYNYIKKIKTDNVLLIYSHINFTIFYVIFTSYFEGCS